MSADGGHLGWRSGSLDIILKVDNLRTIHAMFALNWLTGFRGNMSADGGHLGWRSVLQDIFLKVDYLRTIHAMFALFDLI